MGEEFHLPSKIFGFPVMMNRKWIIFKKNFLKNYLIFLYFVVILKWVRELSLSFLYLVSHEIKLFLRKFYQETSLSHVKLNKESFHWLFLFLKVIDPFFSSNTKYWKMWKIIFSIETNGVMFSLNVKN